ncbi:hypothetical protein TrLO_g12708 [Triparma laevis f. longispina]|uniref:Uncharacterized protein n=1 Tax=Triparma laevis f. longispina TaxID=1714387 RepID=A0A9W7A3Z2_9STRA|nr:hypothetical protein TrLO_g12708 [Triparma laevis f. longispina]
MSQPSSFTAKKRKTSETVDVPPNSIASYFKVLEHPINTFTTTTMPKPEASTEDPPTDDIESSDSEDKADDKDSPLVPLHRPCSSIALTLLSSRVRTRSPYTIPPSVEVASLKRFKSRTRLIPPPNNVYSNSNEPSAKTVTHLTTSSDHLLLSVGYASGLIEVYHVDDIEFNDMSTPFKKKSAKSNNDPQSNPLLPIAQFIQFSRSKISSITWDPTLDKTYVSYVGSLRITTIDWNVYLSSSAARSVPYTTGLGVKCVPYTKQTTFPNDRDTIECMLTIPASKGSNNFVCKACSSTKCIVAGTNNGNLVCYCLSSKHSASKSTLFSIKVIYDGSINPNYPNHSNSVRSVHKLLHNNIYYVAVFSGHGQINIFNLTKVKKRMMGNSVSPLKVCTIDFRDVCLAFRNVDFRVGGDVLGENGEKEKENDKSLTSSLLGGDNDFVTFSAQPPRRFEYDSVDNNVLGYGFKNVVRSQEQADKRKQKANSLELTLVLLNGCVYSGSLSSGGFSSSSPKFALALKHFKDNDEGKRYAVINHTHKPAIDARYVSSIHKGVGVLPKGYLVTYKGFLPVNGADVKKVLEDEGRGETEFEAVRRRLENERGGVVEHWKWGQGGEARLHKHELEWKTGDIKCLVSVCGGRYVAVGCENGWRLYG